MTHTLTHTLLHTHHAPTTPLNTPAHFTTPTHHVPPHTTSPRTTPPTSPRTTLQVRHNVLDGDISAVEAMRANIEKENEDKEEFEAEKVC